MAGLLSLFFQSLFILPFFLLCVCVHVSGGRSFYSCTTASIILRTPRPFAVNGAERVVTTWYWTSIDTSTLYRPRVFLLIWKKKKILLFSNWKIRRIEVVVVVGHGRRRLMTSSHPPKRFYCGFVFKSMRLEDEDRYRLCLAFGRKSERMKWPAVHVTHDNDDDNDFSKCRESESIGK